MPTHKTGVVSLNPIPVTVKRALMRKARGTHHINSTSLEKNQSPVSGF